MLQREWVRSRKEVEKRQRHRHRSVTVDDLLQSSLKTKPDLKRWTVVPNSCVAYHENEKKNCAIM